MQPLRPPLVAKAKHSQQAFHPQQPQKHSDVSLITAWGYEFSKFLHKPVRATFLVLDQSYEVSGILRAFHPHGQHVVIDADDKCIMIRHPLMIERDRKVRKSTSEPTKESGSC